MYEVKDARTRITVIISVDLQSYRAQSASNLSVEGRRVGLGASLDSLCTVGVEEEIGVVGGILSLHQAVELGVLWCLFAEDRVPQSRWVGGKVLQKEISV